MMHYFVRHHTRYSYTAPVHESVMLLYKSPLRDVHQQPHGFSLDISPDVQVSSHTDFFGNEVHHFDIPQSHRALTIKMSCTVTRQPAPPLPAALDGAETWAALDAIRNDHTFWDWLQPTQLVQFSQPLGELATQFGLSRKTDPLEMVLGVNTAVFNSFNYVLNSTAVDSPIGVPLASRQGVCQDFAHIMIALLRQQGIPARYVSGYLFHNKDYDRSAEDASHAWVEAFLPPLGWVGVDPTNNLIANKRHIRVAVGRDYGDVPPTRGVFKGQAETELEVGVQVIETTAPVEEKRLLRARETAVIHQQMVQQQQQ